MLRFLSIIYYIIKLFFVYITNVLSMLMHAPNFGILLFYLIHFPEVQVLICFIISFLINIGFLFFILFQDDTKNK
jgi:hypothetical protein